MKEIKIEKCNLSALTKKIPYFSLPLYQREYSWEKKNLEEFLNCVKELYESNNNQEEPNIWFIGDIILQKNSERKSTYDIIDGQQRLITVFLILSVIFEKLSKSREDEEKLKTIRNEITEFIFQKEGSEPRLNLNNKDDNDDFRKCILASRYSISKGWEGEKNGKIVQAYDFFTRQISWEECLNIYDTIINNFWFSLIIIDEETSPWEIFMALNTTGLELNISDLVKSLFISRGDSKYSQERIFVKWTDEVVKKVCPFLKKVGTEMEKFLTIFYMAKFAKGMHDIKKKDLYKLYRREIKKEENKNPSPLLNEMVNYAEVYEKIINIDDNCKEWWKKYWSLEMFNNVYDIHHLNYRDWFLPLVLEIHFQFNGKSKEEKETITKKLRKIITYVFRVITIRGGKQKDRNLGRTVQGHLLRDMNEKKILLTEKGWVNNLIQTEFEDSTEFWKELENYQTEGNSGNKIWKFIFKTYYLNKLLTTNGIGKGIKESINEDIFFEYNVEHLEPQNSRNKKETVRSWKNAIGNITLMRQTDNTFLSNKEWEEKRFDIKDLGKNCLMNFLEEEKWTEEEDDIYNLVEKRKKHLIKDFKELGIFEPN